MIELLLKLHPTVQMALISFLSLLIFVLAKKGYSVIKTKDGWKFGPRKKDEVMNNTEVNVHMQCEHFDDYKNTLFNLAKLSYKLAVLEMKIDLVDSQLDYAVKKGSEMIGTMRTVYLSILADKRESKDDITRAKCFVLYESLLEDIIQSKIFMILKMFFRKKSLDDMSEAEFRIGKEDNTRSIMQKITEIIDKKYIYDDEISRVELFEANQSKKYEIIGEFYDIFDQARIFAIEHKEKIVEINSKIEKLLTGGKVHNEISDIRSIK